MLVGGTHVKAIRESMGLSQVQFCAKYGIPRRTLEDWEDGKRNPPAYVITLLKKVAEYEKAEE